MGRQIVGIDLGTTHTVIASVDPSSSRGPQVFRVPRLAQPDRLAEKDTLGSVLYAPHAGELKGSPDFIVGDYAEQRGREVPGRAITSSKSWLSYTAVDRNAKILPWGSEDLETKLSPVDAAARILEHVCSAWNRAFPGSPLSEQMVVLTVPASFDPTARQLTLEAAKRAGLAVRLLEEPQAAFYEYLERAPTQELTALLTRANANGHEQARILVCDVGGGTTDLTLLEVTPTSSGEPSINRVAVGRHLLLGGDNMDLALAHRLERSFVQDGARLSARRFSQLVLAARDAKEQLLAPNAPEEVPVTLAAEGSALVGGTRTARLTRSDVEQLLVSGFFPNAEKLPPLVEKRSGLIGFGLPYESEPAITRHVAAFLHRHLGAQAEIDALLLNGGVFLAPRLVEALVSALPQLSGGQVVQLHQPHPELAVARGAAVYGLSLCGQGPRIGGGSAFGYYIAVENQTTRRRAVCVVPRGSREGEAHRAARAPLALTVGRPVRFELYAKDIGTIHAPGEAVEIDEDFELTCPVAAHFEDGRIREVPVVLEGELSAVGTLELSCVSTTGDTEERFALAFELRGQETALSPTKADASRAVSVRPPSTKLSDAESAVLRIYGRGKVEVSPREVKDLVRHLEQLLGPRPSWDLESCRRLYDCIGPKHQSRRRSLDHERLYFMLSGYLLRPGFGHPLDRTRVRDLVPLFPAGLQFSDEVRGWQQFFIAFRRICPGMLESEQSLLYETLLPHVTPATLRGKKKGPFRPLAEPELLECASWLERLATAQRVALGEAILERTWTKREPLLWNALGRIGARVPVYASIHHTVPVHVVETWLDHLLREKWDELPNAPLVAVQLGRLTGDRARDVSESLRQDLCRRLERLALRAELAQPLREFVPIEERERNEQFGEELPVGLKWLDRDE